MGYPKSVWFGAWKARAGLEPLGLMDEWRSGRGGSSRPILRCRGELSAWEGDAVANAVASGDATSSEAYML